MKNLFKILFFFGILISGCEKKSGTPVIIPDDSIDEIVSNAQLTLEENSVSIDFSKTLISDFLSEFFQDKEYKILDEPLDVNYRKIYFAVRYIMELPKIFDSAIGFEIQNETVVPYFFIKDFQFIDKNNTIFMDFSKGYAGIYGFNFLYSYPRAEGYTPGLVMETYFDNGRRIADSFSIMWNEETMAFEDIKPDSELWRPGL